MRCSRRIPGKLKQPFFHMCLLSGEKSITLECVCFTSFSKANNVLVYRFDGYTHVHRQILGPQIIIKRSSRFPTSEVSDHLWRVETRQFHGISSHQCYPSFKWTFTQRLFSSQLPLFVGFSVLFVIIGFPSTAASSNSTLDGASVRSPCARGQTPTWAVSSSQIIYTRAPARFGCKRSGSVE